MAVFRGKLLAVIRQAFARGALGLPEPMRPQQFINLVNCLGHPTKTRWSVRIMERYRHGAGVVTYVAHYLRGGPIKNAAMQSGRPSISIHGMFASPSGATAIGTATAPPAAGHAVPAARANPAEASRHQSILQHYLSLCLDLQGLQSGCAHCRHPAACWRPARLPSWRSGEAGGGSQWRGVALAGCWEAPEGGREKWFVFPIPYSR